MLSNYRLLSLINSKRHSGIWCLNVFLKDYKNFMKKNVFFVIIIILLCYACADNSTTKMRSGTVLSINLELAQPVMEVLEKTGSIPLENKGDTFPGQIHKMMVDKDALYLLDTYRAPGLYKYDRNGRFLTVYNRVGQGNGEFIGLSDFQLYGDTIYLLDSSGKKIIKLDKLCRFHSSTNLSVMPLAFAKDSLGGIWMDVGNTALVKDAYTLFYEHKHMMQNVLPIPSELRNMTYAPYFTLINVGNEIHFLPEMQNKIYSCENGEAVLIYYLDFGKHWFTSDFLKENRNTDLMIFFRKIKEAGYVSELNYLESERLLLLSFNCNAESYLLVYDKDNQKQVLCVKENDELFRPLAICGEEILFVEMTDSCNVINKYCCKE